LSWRTPNTYRKEGIRQGTATSKFYETRDNLPRRTSHPPAGRVQGPAPARIRVHPRQSDRV